MFNLHLVQPILHPNHLCAQQDIATYSALTVDKATVAWRLLLQDTAPPAIMKTYPDVDQQVSLHPP